ncbi:MAG: NAD(P)/FAD-dependent oxidoreductase [Bacteroidota bacterium]
MKVNVPDLNVPRVVIIGGGFGGIRLAGALKNAPVQVVMFDKQNYHCFQPLLYQVATGGLEPDSIAFPIRKMFKRQRNFFFRMAEVKDVRRDKKTICTSIGEISYDYLVLATGSKTNFFDMEGLEVLSHGMKNIPEALDLRSLILNNFEKAVLTSDLDQRNALMNFVIVGAGPTGVETAGALAELKRFILPADYPELDLRRMEIHLVEASGEVLPGMSPDSTQSAHKALEKLGVNLWMNTRVEGYDGAKVTTNTQKTLTSRTVIWAAGVKGVNLPGLEEFEAWGGRVKVDQFNRIAGQDNLFAIGDVALMQEEKYPDGHPMVAPVAIQQADILARNIKSLIYNRKLKPFAYRDKGTMATIGRNKAVVDVRRFHFKGWFAWIMWMVVHLFSLAGFRNRIVVFVNWFWSYVTYDRGSRLIMDSFKRKSSVDPPQPKVPEVLTKEEPNSEVVESVG